MTLAKIITKTVRGFFSHDCFYRASALTFYTLLSLVPLLAIAFGFAQHLGLEKYLEEEIARRFVEQPEVGEQLTQFALSVLKQPSNVLAYVSLFFLLWTVMQLFYSIEHALNAIWGVAEPRSYLRQLRDYLLMVIICPLIILVSAALSFVVVSYATQVFHSHWLTQTGYFFLSLLLNGILFSVLYFAMPNTRVPWKAALLGGMFAGAAYQVTQWVYLYFQIGVASYGAVYGSFAALPLFLVWVNTSWTIFLGGAELAHQLQVAKSSSGEEADL